jgi:hypothetical protein
MNRLIVHMALYGAMATMVLDGLGFSMNIGENSMARKYNSRSNV